MSDKIEFAVLKDGTIRIETGKVSAPNHLNSERFLAECAKLAGGKQDIKHKHGHHGHSHSHGQDAHQH